MSLPRCETTGITRVFCMCTDCEPGFTMTAEEQELMACRFEPGTWPEQPPRPPARVIDLDGPQFRHDPDAVVRREPIRPKETRADRIRRWLIDLPNDVALLPDMANTSNGQPAPSSPANQRIPIKAAVLDVPEQIAVTLAHWIHIAHHDMDDDPGLPEPTITSMCDWLLRHLLWITTGPWSLRDDDTTDTVLHQFTHDLRLLRTHTQAILGERDPYTPRCDQCGQRLEAMDDNSWYRCTNHNPIRIIDHWAEIGRLTAIQPPMTINELSAAIDVPTGTIGRWVAAGALTPTTDAKRGRLFDVWQARQVKANLRHGPNKSRARNTDCAIEHMR